MKISDTVVGAGFVTAGALIIAGTMNYPILDGGHIMFFTYEGISGKPLDVKKVNIAQVIGMSILIAIMIFATYKDFLRIFGNG